MTRSPLTKLTVLFFTTAMLLATALTLSCSGDDGGGNEQPGNGLAGGNDSSSSALTISSSSEQGNNYSSSEQSESSSSSSGLEIENSSSSNITDISSSSEQVESSSSSSDLVTENSSSSSNADVSSSSERIENSSSSSGLGTDIFSSSSEQGNVMYHGTIWTENPTDDELSRIISGELAYSKRSLNSSEVTIDGKTLNFNGSGILCILIPSTLGPIISLKDALNTENLGNPGESGRSVFRRGQVIYNGIPYYLYTGNSAVPNWNINFVMSFQ